MNNETATAMIAAPLDLEALREKGIQDNQEFLATKKAEQLVDVDKMIAFLQANREHIAALFTTIIPFETTVLVQPDGGKVIDGLTTRLAVHSVYRDLAIKRTQDSMNRETSGPSGFLGALLSR